MRIYDRAIAGVPAGEERGSGRTTKQMQDAPQGAVYIWNSVHLGYPSELAKMIGRGDLQVVSSEWLESGQWQGTWPGVGKEYPWVVLDHAYSLNTAQWSELDALRTAWHGARWRGATTSR